MFIKFFICSIAHGKKLKMVVYHVAIVSQCQFYMNGKLHHMSNIGSSKHLKLCSPYLIILFHMCMFVSKKKKKEKKKGTRTRNPQLINFFRINILCTYNLNFC